MSYRFAAMLMFTPAACVLSVWRPFWGLCCLVFLYYFRPDAWGSPEWFRPVLWITIAVGVGWAVRVRTFRFHGIFGISLLVLLAQLASSLQAVEDQPTAIGMVMILGKLMIVQFLAMQCIDTPQKLNAFMWANIAGMLWNYKTILVLGSNVDRVDVGVAQGGGANYLAMILAMFIPFLFMKVIQGQGRERLFAFGLLPATILCLVFTGSRGGFVAMGAVLLYLILKSNRKLLGTTIAASVVILTLVLLPQDQKDRFMLGFGLGGERDASAQSRIELWKAALVMFNENKLLGVGPDNYALLSPRYAGFYASRNIGESPYIPGVKKQGFVAHSTWLQTLAEGGILTFIPFVLLFPMVFAYMWRVRRLIPLNAPDGKLFHSLSLALSGLFIAFIVASTFGSHIKIDFLWWYLGAVSALSMLAEDRALKLGEQQRRIAIEQRQTAARRQIPAQRGYAARPLTRR